MELPQVRYLAPVVMLTRCCCWSSLAGSPGLVVIVAFTLANGDVQSVAVLFEGVFDNTTKTQKREVMMMTMICDATWIESMRYWQYGALGGPGCRG